MTTTVQAPRSGVALRRGWWLGTVLLTVGVTAFLIVTRPVAGAPQAAVITRVIFIGSGVHVAATAWFFTVPEVRRHAFDHPRRYLVVPALLIVGTAVLTVLVPQTRWAWILAPYFAWQFFHYQKQNLGMAALAAVSHRSPSLGQLERHCLVGAGVTGIAGLLSHPELLGLTGVPVTARWLFPVARLGFGLAVVGGAVALTRRAAAQRPLPLVVIYLLSLVFFAPVFLFESPVRASASFAVAHGYQYLLIVGLVATGAPGGGRSDLARRVGPLALMIVIALAGGWLLDRGSHQAGDVVGRAVFGAYLGVVMSHFVIDAGLWRMRDAFPRAFLTQRLPFLLPPRPEPKSQSLT